MKKLVALLLAALLFGVAGCVPDNKPNGSGGGNGEIENPTEEKEMEKNYVYMWHKDGLKGDENRMFFQSEQYMLSVDGRSGKILAMAPGGEKFTEMKGDETVPVTTSLYIGIGGNYYESLNNSTSVRIIDSGRYVNRLDDVSIRFQGQGLSKWGRTEYVATKNFFAFNYDLISSESGSYGAKFEMALDGTTPQALADGRGYTLLDENGNGFAFIKRSTSQPITITAEGNKLVFSQTLTLTANEWGSTGVIVIPVKGGDLHLYEKFKANQALQVTAVAKDGSNLDLAYDESEGIWYINTSSIITGAQNSATARNNYDIAELTIKNDGGHAEPVIGFYKDRNLSITGISPVIRDAETHEPTGEQVQVSKNWHTYSKTSDTDSTLAAREGLFSGPWYHGFYSLEAGTGVTKREYVCAFGNWGSAYAASHGQLCLIGWGGNQLWDQSALGSWGESVTYDPDQGLGRSMIDDVRPFLVRSSIGGYKEYDWTGNVGGANFLDYIEESDRNLVNQRITYYAQAPNLTRVNYSGITSNGKIKSDVNISLGRTDDVNRNFYKIRYEFMEDVTAGRLSLFKVAADGYADNAFAKYAYGDSESIVERAGNSVGTAAGYVGSYEPKNDSFWFGLYNSSTEEENGDVMFTVREYSANINGKTYNRPGINFFGTSNYKPQMSCEVTVPAAVGKTVKKGSVVEMVIEYTILPGRAQDYYGTADYLLQTKDLMGTPEAMYQQVVGGKTEVKASVGEITSSLPIEIAAAAGEVAAQFTVSGGLGYVPVSIGGLDGYKGYKLQVKTASGFTDVDQSVKGNDFWQTEKTSDGKYRLTFNVKNTDGLNFNIAKEYRLVKN